MNTKLKYIAPALLAVAVGSANAATVITVANAGFEAQTLADGKNNSTTTNTDDGSATFNGEDGSITGWAFSSSTDHLGYLINPDTGFQQATEGNNAAFIQNNTLTQTLSGLSLSSGDTVTVTFDLWVTNSGSATNFEVNFAGLGVQNPSTAPTIGGAAVAQSLTFTLTSDITSGDLAFRSTAGGKRYRLDNISVTAVPEPSSAALLGLGGLALILRRRK